MGEHDDYPWLGDLAAPRAWPAGSGEVRRIDTHISHVFLTADRAWKLRRPVRLAFLDFSRPEERLADCRRELALNRRLAPDVYLGLAPVLLVDGHARFGEVSEEPSEDPRAVEHAVVMRRLPDGRDLRSMLERGEARAAHVDRVAATLARFHAAHGLGRPSPFAAEAWLERTCAPAVANFDALAHADARLAPPAEVDEVRRLAAAFVRARRGDFERRREDGRVVDGHGDLHAEHVWFEADDAEPLLVDCLEFREDFRRIDAASDAAFLAMDLAYRGRADLASRFLRRYARESGDYHLFAVVDFFLAYRALVRAKVASLVASDPSLGEAQRGHAARSTREHLDLGLSFLAPRPRAALVLVAGGIGSGKTTVAEALADRCGGVVISSDHVRREPAAGGASPAHAAPADAAHGEGRYSDESRSAVYRRLLEEARHVLFSGRTAILDATWSRVAWRDEARAWAKEHASRCLLVEVHADEATVRARLARREAEGNDASEAGPALYDAMRAAFEPTSEWPADARVGIDTGEGGWERRVDGIADSLATAAPSA